MSKLLWGEPRSLGFSALKLALVPLSLPLVIPF